MNLKHFVICAGISLLASSSPVFAGDEVDMEASKRVTEMLLDLGGSIDSPQNGKVVPCHYRGTRKISIKKSDGTTRYSGEYRNCIEKGMVRDGIYTLVAAGEFILDSKSKRSINGELFDAVLAGNAGLVRKLIKSKADVNYTESIRNSDDSLLDEWSPLMTSVVTGNLEIMKMLVAGGAWVNYMNGSATNAVWLAASNGQLDMVKFLADSKAYLNNLNVDDNTPLMAAAIGGHDAVIEFLLGRHADPNLRNKNGDDGLMLALENGHSPAARLFVNAGVDINRANGSGATPLMIAVVEGNEDIVRLLLERGADQKAVSSSGKTALDYALLKENAVIVELLKKSSR